MRAHDQSPEGQANSVNRDGFVISKDSQMRTKPLSYQFALMRLERSVWRLGFAILAQSVAEVIRPQNLVVKHSFSIRLDLLDKPVQG